MKRQTRVPASTVVRMNSASNRMAKWYQMPIIVLPPRKPDRISAMPTANVGAPPVRDMIVLSPTSCAIWVSMSGVTAKPQDEITCAACCRIRADQRRPSCSWRNRRRDGSPSRRSSP